MLEFLYFSPKGETRREIGPYYLIFQWASWYVWGWCTRRKDFRLFKLNRMEELQLCEKGFEKRHVPVPDLGNEKIFPGSIQVKAVFEAECKWRLVEEFGRSSFEEMEDGRLLFHADYTDKENLITWLLTFGERGRLLEPEELRDAVRWPADRNLYKYAKVIEGSVYRNGI